MSCPGVRLGVPWGVGDQKKNSEIQHDLVCELHAPAQFFGVPFPWGLGEGSKIKFLNMVMWHIKLKGMNSISGFTEIF